MEVCTPCHSVAAGMVCHSTVCRAEEPPSSTLSEPPSPGRSLYLGTHTDPDTHTRDEWAEDIDGMCSQIENVLCVVVYVCVPKRDTSRPS